MIRLWIEKQQRMIHAVTMPGPAELTQLHTLQGKNEGRKGGRRWWREEPALLRPRAGPRPGP